MNPINFPESNLTLLGDPAEGVSNLPVHRSPDQGIIVSCWQPDDRERAMIAEGIRLGNNPLSYKYLFVE